MVSTSTASANWKSPVVWAVFVAATFVPAQAMSQLAAPVAGPASATPSPSRVRAGNASAAALLRGGMARSATFRAIVETIEHSDLIVYVETRAIRLPGQLQLVAATPGCRHIRISVRAPGLDTEMVAWLGHELWHAVELAGAPDVRDQTSLLRFYNQMGNGGSLETTAESVKAQDVWATVLHEARAAGRPQSPGNPLTAQRAMARTATPDARRLWQ
jgi:hypothetical protein